jgi:DNA-binding MarR family transcriptional regulator
LYLKDNHLKEFIEKIFVSYRETFSDAKKILDKYSIGVAHHKVLHLLSLYEGITISELLKKLKVTKQSLNRVLKDLIQLEAIEFKKDKKDTRLKHVYLSDKGLKLFEELFSMQKKRIYKALIKSNSKEILNFNNVLKKIINE